MSKCANTTTKTLKNAVFVTIERLSYNKGCSEQLNNGTTDTAKTQARQFRDNIRHTQLTGVFPSTVSSAPAAAAAGHSVNDMTFMVPGNAATSTPAIVQKTKPSMFGFAADTKPAAVNLFGGPPVADASGKAPAFGSVGGGSMFGGASTGGFGMAPAAAATTQSTASAVATPPSNAFGGFGGVAPSPAPFGSTNFGATKPTFGAPSAQPPQFDAAESKISNAASQPLAQSSAQPNGNQPFLTVAGTYANPPAANAGTPKHASATGATATGPNTTGGSVEDDKVIRKMIAEEIGSFEIDLARMLQRSRSVQIELGSREELAATAKQLAELQDISGQATESTDTLTLEIQSLRLALNEAFAMLTEAQTKQQMFGHME